MTTTETETILTERLTRLASYAPDSPTVEFSDLPLARVTEEPRMRVPVWAVAAGVAVVIGAGTIGFVTLTSSSQGTGHSNAVTGGTAPVMHTLTIDAQDFYLSDESHLQTTNFSVPAGTTEIRFVSVEGSHTLVFAAPEFPNVALAAPDGRATATVDLVEGRVYTVFCALPGHRDSGMEATITVGPPTATKSVDQVAGTPPTVPGR